MEIPGKWFNFVYIPASQRSKDERPTSTCSPKM